jgi:hypothetical protein
MRFVALMLLSSLLATGAVAAEKVAKPAPEPAGNAEREAAQRKSAAEWIRRCDKLQGDRRMQCLEEARARIVQRFAGPQSDANKQPAAKEQTDAKNDR